MTIEELKAGLPEDPIGDDSDTARVRWLIGIIEAEARWKCFHCGKTFTTAEDAEEHFGNDREHPRPAECEILYSAMCEAVEHFGIHSNHHNYASVRRLVVHIRQQTARECAAIAKFYDEGGKPERGIRTHFRLSGDQFADGEESPALLEYLSQFGVREQEKA